MAKLFLLIHHHLLLLLLLLLLSTYPLTAAETGSLPSPPPEGDRYRIAIRKFNSTTIIIVVAFTCAFLAIGCFSLCLHHHDERSSRRRDRLGVAAARLCCRMPKGLEPEVIEAYFPTFRYSDVKGIKTIDDGLECAVCLNEFEDDETLRLIPKCSHVFHPDCIGAWLSSHTTCPVCRADLAPTTKDLSLSSVQMSEPDNYSVEPEDQFTTNNEQNHIVIHVGPGENQQVEEVLATQSTNVNLLNPTNLNRKRTPLCSSPLGWRLDKLFSMSSFSTETSMVQPGENCERFTLRLSRKEQSQLMTSKLSDIRCESFSKERSAKKGYKSDNNIEIKRSKNQFYYDRFNQGGPSGSDLTRSI